MKKLFLLILTYHLINICVAQIEGGKISFFVKNSSSGKGIPAVIKLTSESFKKSIETKENTVTEIEMPNGKYEVEVAAPFYKKQNENYTIEKEKTVTITVMLDPLDLSETMKTSEGKAIICGYIMDKITAQPIVNAKIKLGINGNEVYTDKNGFFKIEMNSYTPKNSSGIQPLITDLYIEKNGYKNYIYSDLPLYEDNLFLKINLENGLGFTEQKYLQKIISERDDLPVESDQILPIDNKNILDPLQINQAVYTCSAPTTIRLNTNGNNGPCVSCTGCTSVVQLSLETYVSGGLDNEWIASWNDASLKAGAVAYRTYGAYFIQHPMNANFDIVAYPCRHNWDGTTTFAATVNATSATSGEVLVTGANTIAFIEYAAETNNSINCGDGYSGDIANWPCISDAPCVGSTFSGHHRGMCQWGSHRWAQQGKTYTWILDHYYNPAGIYRCNSTTAGLKTADFTEPFVIYPNPTSGDFTIELNRVANKKIAIIITNALGQILFKNSAIAPTDNYLQKINLRGHAGGLYFVKITVGEDYFVKTINLAD